MQPREVRGSSRDGYGAATHSHRAPRSAAFRRMLHRTPGRRMAGVLLALMIATAAAVAITETRDRVTTTPAKPAARFNQGAPNVVVVMTDDQALDTMRAMPRTRRLLGGRGVTFENAVVSFPLCCPSRATFLTGQYAHNHGVLDNHPPRGGYPGSTPSTRFRCGCREPDTGPDSSASSSTATARAPLRARIPRVERLVRGASVEGQASALRLPA